MNQNGFMPRNKAPGYSYGQPNSVPQNGYPGAGTAPQDRTQIPGGFGMQAANSQAFGFNAQQAGNGYVATPQTGGYTPVPPMPPAGGYNPMPQTPAAGGYNPMPQNPATGGYNPMPQNPVTGGYNPMPQNPATGGYSPMPQTPVTGGYNPIPQTPANTGYSPVPPAAANTVYNAYRPQPAPSSPAGSFIPKTPYSTGYTAPGYQQGYQKPAANGYPQGYSAYAQMGRNAPQNNEPQQKPAQVPLNGGGYVPQQVKVRRRPPETSDIVLYAVGGVLILLFILGMFIPVDGFQWLKWLFLVPAAATTALLWIRPVTDDSKRLCFTIVAGALCIAMIISLIASSGRNTGDPTNSAAGQQSRTQQDAGGNTDSGGSSDTGGQNAYTGSDNPSGSGTDGYGGSNYQGDSTGYGQQNGSNVANASAKERLRDVFISWSRNDLDSMVELCLPSWRVKQENAKKTLFHLLQNRTPIGDVDLVNDPAQNGDSLSFILQVTISRNNGKEPILSQMTVRMVIESGIWYVDPNSLKSNEIQETPDPNVTPAVTSTPEPYIDGNTLLYYNPNGGKLYHLDPNCVSVHSKYTPLKGTFTYSQINDGQYAALEPCNVCGAPLRQR